MAKTGSPARPETQMQKFVGLLFGLSAKLICIPPPAIEDEIDRSLLIVREFWGFDSIAVATISSDNQTMSHLHISVAPGARVPPQTLAQKEAPWFLDTLIAGKTVFVRDSRQDIPETGQEDRDYFASLCIGAFLAIPFGTESSARYALTAFCRTATAPWPTDAVRALGHLVGIIASSLERKRAADRRDEIDRFDQLLSETSAKYINMPAKELRQGIQKDLGRLGTFLGVDRCIFYLADAEKDRFEIERPFNWWLEKDHSFVMKLDRWVTSQPDFHDNLRYCFERWRAGETVKFSHIDELPVEAERAKRVFRKFGDKSMLSVPISVAGSIVAALVIVNTRVHRQWDDDLIPRLRLFGEVFANALIRRQSDEKLNAAFTEIKELKKQIEADYVYLREEIKLEHNFEEIIGQGNAIKYILFKIEQVAPTDSTVLVLGETGTGKELVARAIHNASKRRNRPLIKVDCATLTPSLIESELFGHEKGAFTGAANKRVGRFELANGATVFLDEVGELPLELQPKLLRVLQEGTFERVGGSVTLHTDVRVIAATNRDLETEVQKGRFRSDLWYRLNAFPISVPPLRKRVEDIPLLVGHFVNKYGNKMGKRTDVVPQKALHALTRYSWPGNVRELEHVIERAVITSDGSTLQIEIPTDKTVGPAAGLTLQEYERECILRTLEATAWTIEGPHGAASQLGLRPSTLRNRMTRLDIRRPAPKRF
jgi:formate hydrogenlyase transcriptional activator